MFRLVKKTGECVVIGDSEATKPSPVDGYGFIELDTGKVYEANGVAWIESLNPSYLLAAGYSQSVKLLPQVFTGNSLVNVSGLSFPVTLGGIYSFQFQGHFQSTSGSNGMKLGLTFPLATEVSCLVEIAISGSMKAGYITGSGGSVTGNAVASPNTNYPFRLEGIIIPALSGTVQLQAAGDASLAVISVRAGSNVTWDRLN